MKDAVPGARRLLLALARVAHVVTAGLCAALLLWVASGELLVVVLRYVFGVGFLELQDSVAYAFGALAVLAIPLAVHDDAHVRVDVLRERQGSTARRRTDLAAFALFLVPVFGFALWSVWPEIVFSWSIREGSVETGGLPGYFLVKSVLPLASLLTILQGAARLLTRDG